MKDMLSKEEKEGHDAFFENEGINDVPYYKNPEKNNWEMGWLSAATVSKRWRHIWNKKSKPTRKKK